MQLPGSNFEAAWLTLETILRRRKAMRQKTNHPIGLR
jgi:hypothetical protein